MKRFLRTVFLLPILTALLLSACTTGNTTNVPSVSTAVPTTTATPTPGPAKTAADICPAPLSAMTTCLTPHAMRVAYGVDSLIQKGFTGKGETVVDMVSFGSPTLQQDMDVFDQAYNLPAVNLQIISPINEPENDPHGDKDGWGQETELDVQIIHAIAPDAKIVVLTSPVAETEGTFGLPEYRQLEQYIIDHKLGNIVSQSWGASELTLADTQGQQEIQQWNSILQAGTTQDGISYFSSSGDEGATDYRDDNKDLGTTPTTSFAPDNPWVTSVGGTTITRTSTNFQERAWNGSGGGFSRFYQMPDYQKTLPAATQTQFNNRRGVPDVSAAADPFTGLGIYLSGQWTLAGGTSASAPVWAGIAAIADQMAGHPLGFLNPGLYKLAASSTYHQDFHDIVKGDNTNGSAKVQGYPAVPGWDPVTGLGTPNAEKLIPDLIAAMK
jgi:subtilase family serine protease